MAFDSGESTGAWIFVIATWAYPIFPIAMVIGAWIAFAKHKDKLAGILSGLSFVLPLCFFLIVGLASMI
jgi:hypothetical protein